MSAVVGGLFASFLDCRRKEEPPRLEWKNKFDSIVKEISNLKPIFLGNPREIVP